MANVEDRHCRHRHLDRGPDRYRDIMREEEREVLPILAIVKAKVA